MVFQSNIIVYLLAANFVCCFGIAIYSYLKTHNNYQKYFTLMMLMIAGWSLSGALEAAATALDVKVLFSKIEYAFALTSGILFLRFAAGFAKIDGKWKKYYLTLWLIPLFIFIAALTNEHHHLLWRNFTWSAAGNNILTYHHGPLFSVASIFSVIMILLGQIILFKALGHLPELSRKQAKLFITASYFPLIALVLYSIGFTFVDGLDIIVLSFSLTGLLLLVGISRYNILDIVPIVKQRISSIIPDGLLVLDHHQQLIFMNEVATALLESQYGKLKHDVSAVDWLSVTVNAFKEEGIKKKEVTVQDKNGEWYNVMLSLLTDRSQRLKGIFIVMRNISQRKRLEIQSEILNKKVIESNQALKELNAQKDKILSIIGHDLKTSFHQITSLAQIIKENAGMFDKTVTLELISDIDTAALNGGKVLEDLLIWAKEQQEFIHIRPEVFNLHEVIDEVMSFLNRLIKSKELIIENLLPANASVYADRNMITIAIRNIIANAIKFSHPGGNIRLECKIPDPAHMNLLITDHGQGIKPEILDKLFNPGSKYTTLGTGGEKGNGLGLSFSYEMMIRNNGNIQAESEIGKTTTFTLTLPTVKPEEPGKYQHAEDAFSMN